MGKTHSTIELNGQRYNAYTGALVDGIRAPKLTHAPIQQHAVPARQSEVNRAHTPSKKIHKHTQPSKTLMRHAVKKPTALSSPSVAATRPAAQAATSPAIASRFHNPDPRRLKRAENIQKLPNISRFGVVGDTPEAAHAPVVQSAPQVAAKPEPSNSKHHQQHVQKSHEVVEKGLRAATSHEQHAHKKPKLHHRISRKLGVSSRATGLAAGSLAVILFSGFFAYQNIPSMSVRYASAKAGVRASLPGYRPAGFAVNKRIQYAPGQITIAYKTNTDKRSYNVTQKNTSWNSEALRDHLVTATGNEPQSFPDKGRTIYLHDGDQADWVNNGIWYSISGDSDLNTDQLIKIATSI